MFDRLINGITGDYNQKQIDKLLPIVKQINEIDEEWDALTDADIKAKTPQFIERVQKGETLDDILPEAFAAVKQAAKRMKGTVCMVK